MASSIYNSFRFDLLTCEEITFIYYNVLLLDQVWNYEVCLYQLICSQSPVSPGDLISKEGEKFLRENKLSYRCIVNSEDGMCVASQRGGDLFKMIWRDPVSDIIPDKLSTAVENRKFMQMNHPRGVVAAKLYDFRYKAQQELILNHHRSITERRFIDWWEESPYN